MAHQYQGILGTQVSVTGNTTITIDSRLMKKSNVTFWDHGCFGISVTKGGPSFSVYIVGTLQGIQVPIAGISGVATTTSTLIPIVNHRIIGTTTGTTQNALVGIPTPTQIVFGNSGIVGQTYSAVVSAALHSY